MALVGGGGAPNVAGANPAGVGSSINYVGNHAYAYSGKVEATDAGQTMLRFVTSQNYVKGIIQFYVSEESTDDTVFSLLIDGQNVFEHLVYHQPGNNGPSMNEEIYIILPPFASIEVKATNSSSTARDTYCTITGRVY